MARSRYEDEIIVSWVELHRDARYLSELLHAKGSWKGIIAITRGGLVPAALVARELDIRLVDTICVTSYASAGTGKAEQVQADRKSTRLNSSHLVISYAVFCLQEKKKTYTQM